MVNVGIAGIGFMGVTHFDAYAKVRGAQVAAICTRSQAKLDGDWSTVQGNFGDAGGKRDLGEIARYRDFADLIPHPSLDLISICLPTPQHVDETLAALEAGKHVVVEKPIALTVDAADRMIAAAKANDRLLMVAQVLRFWPQWRYLKSLVAERTFGKLVALNLTRIIAVPDWSKEMADLGANGGPLIDLHIHDVDFILYLLGKPKRVHTIGRERGNAVIYVASTYDFGGDDAPIVSCQSGAAATRGRPFMHSFDACFERATVRFSQATEPAGNDPASRRSASQVLTVSHADKRIEHPQFDQTDGFVPQMQHVVDCVASNRQSDVIAAQSARDSLALVYLEAESARSRAQVDVP